MISHEIAAMVKGQCDSLTIILGHEAEEIASLCETPPFATLLILIMKKAWEHPLL